MMDDPNVMRPRKEWAVSFGIGAILLGCLVAAVVFMALTFVLLSTAPEGALGDDAPEGSVLRLTMLIGGLAALVILVVGPTVSFAVGWLMRNVRNQSMHVIAFAAAGVVIGGAIGLVGGSLQAVNLLAAMIGASAAAGRAAVARLARV